MKTLKANIILNKKHIVLAALVLVLGAAVYLNWQFAAANEDLTLTSALSQTEDGRDLPIDEATGLNEIPIEDAEATEGEVIQGGESGEIENQATNAEGGSETGDDINIGETKVKNLGDALFVNAPTDAVVTGKTIVDENYFANARLSKEKAHDISAETIAMILDNEELSSEDKQAASDKVMALTDIIEAENRIENLIKAKGFSDCVVYLTQNSANVVVKTDGLNQDSATQIKNIIVSEGKIAGESVTITEIN